MNREQKLDFIAAITTSDVDSRGDRLAGFLEVNAGTLTSEEVGRLISLALFLHQCKPEDYHDREKLDIASSIITRALNQTANQ